MTGTTLALLSEQLNRILGTVTFFLRAFAAGPWYLKLPWLHALCAVHMRAGVGCHGTLGAAAGGQSLPGLGAVDASAEPGGACACRPQAASS